MLGDLYTLALDGVIRPEIEFAGGHRAPMPVDGWLRGRPGDRSLLDRCAGPTLDIGSGPGRLTAALAGRGIPALGIDITAGAVRRSRAAGALALCRDVFGTLPGAGRWERVLLADGNIGIGGDPAALLRRAAELLGPAGLALIEAEPPGTPLASELVRLRHGEHVGGWFRWARVGVCQLRPLARAAGLSVTETWTDTGRWFAAVTAATPRHRAGPGRRPRAGP